MLIYIGADHKGFKLKEALRDSLNESGYEVVDVGNVVYDENDDYPDFASLVARKVSLDPENSRGILICGSGVGMSVVANRYQNVRAALVSTPDQAMASKNDDNANVLVFSSDFVTENEAIKILTVWMQTPFSEEERHKRRLDKLANLDLNK
ncbi:RpiB/LacA/LacB family sugar-phosphate isomerase [Candidatus Wolfebacteria bacterium]|nr:RpiB/LacA/LacB family sugar-phosphate isomerase [Candidatus Wolfebacteria bacterium]